MLSDTHGYDIQTRIVVRFGGLTMMGKEFKEQKGEQVLGSIRLFSRF